MDLPQPVTFKSYSSILQHVSGNVVEMAEQFIHEDAVRLVEVTKEENSENLLMWPWAILTYSIHGEEVLESYKYF